MAERIARVLETVQLGDLGERYPRQLSGGQQQRIALARAMVIEPSILLLDEPLANLDAKLREEMRFFVRSLQKRVGITTVYVTHDQAEAMVISDRIVVMFDGHIHQVGAPDDIYSRPVSREVASFIGLSNFVEGRVRDTADDGVCTLETAVGTLRCAYSETLAKGQAVTLIVRPEAIALSDAAPPGTGANAISGRVSRALLPRQHHRLPDRLRGRPRPPGAGRPVGVVQRRRRGVLLLRRGARLDHSGLSARRRPGREGTEVANPIPAPATGASAPAPLRPGNAGTRRCSSSSRPSAFSSRSSSSPTSTWW